MTISKTAAVETPELDKRREAIAPRPVNDVLTAFVDWLSSQGIVLAKWGKPYEVDERCGRCRPAGIGRKAAQEPFFGGKDLEALRRRERQVVESGLLTDAELTAKLDELPDCPECGGDPNGERHVTHYDDDQLTEYHHGGYDRLFAAFLDLDLDKIDEEQRALLDALRA